VINQNLNEEEIKRRLNSDNASYSSVQNFLSSRLLSKNINFRILEILEYIVGGSVVVKALCYKLEGRGFASR
jgi:hypothetical protein